MPIFCDSSQPNQTGENGLLGGEGRHCPGFLRKALGQSGFENSLRRMQCDQKPAILALQVDFDSKLAIAPQERGSR